MDRGNHSVSGSKTSFKSVGSRSPHDNPFPDTSICQHSNTKEVQGVANSISIEHPHSVCKMSRKQCPTYSTYVRIPWTGWFKLLV